MPSLLACPIESTRIIFISPKCIRVWSVRILACKVHNLIIGNVLTDCWIVADADVKGSIIEQFTMFARVIDRAAIAFEIGTIVDE